MPSLVCFPKEVAVSKQMTWVTAVREYLTLPGEGAAAILKEMKALTPKDKEDLKKDFAAIGVEITAPAQS